MQHSNAWRQLTWLLCLINETFGSVLFKDCLLDSEDIVSKILCFLTEEVRFWLCSFFLNANFRYVGILNMFININPMTNAKALISIAKPVMFIRTIEITYEIPNAIEIMQALRGISRVFFFFLLTICFGPRSIKSFKLLRLLWMCRHVDASMIAPTNSAAIAGKPNATDDFWISSLNERSPCWFKHTYNWKVIFRQLFSRLLQSKRMFLCHRPTSCALSSLEFLPTKGLLPPKRLVQPRLLLQHRPLLLLRRFLIHKGYSHSKECSRP